ncbi:MAG: glycoside hydrolase family 15 protein [Deltaproteobacteria bacterium]|nr:glycoside hydrolase family 15 protein [Deltaproteobacteria bacterium]
MARLALIGNCSTNVLIEGGAVRWLCWPRPDSSFVFGGLLDDERGGVFDIEAVAGRVVSQEYVDTTNVLRTRFEADDGAFEVFDFVPRFQQHGRFFRPTMLVRILRRIEGAPLVRVRCRPVYDYGATPTSHWLASNHIAFQGAPAPLRLTSNLPLTHVADERPFVLTHDGHMALTWGQPLEDHLEETCERFLQRTLDYWIGWVKHTRIPRDYQREVLRSALALKLHQYEDTGALLAATTTSLPEFPGSGRCWDYRFCWLRDAYFTLDAFERLGHLEEMERFLVYLRNVCTNHGDVLRPVYTIAGDSHMEERIIEELRGFEGDGPVRVGNQAREHVQNDVYGEMVLATSRTMLDVRLRERSQQDGTLTLLERLLARIEATLDEPDAGPWELRGNQQLHAFTLLTHWAGAHRAADVGRELGLPELVARGERIAATARGLLESRCFDAAAGAFTQAADRTNLDAVMLLVMHFGLLTGDDPRAATHVDAIAKTLKLGDSKLLRRYDVADDFGVQEAAFTVVSFWLVEALHMVGREQEARELFEHLLSLHNGLGLYAEDIVVATGRQSGNFPQAYSHVGLINAAFRLSRPWS